MPNELRRMSSATAQRTIQQLIDETNSDPRRGYGHENVLTQIDIDVQTETPNHGEKLHARNRLAEGEILYLKTTANISTGGTAIDRTDEVHPENVFHCLSASRKIIGLDIAGIDIIAPNHSRTSDAKTAAELSRLTPRRVSGCILRRPKASAEMSPSMSLICSFRPAHPFAHSDFRHYGDKRKNDDHAADRAYFERKRFDRRLYDDRRNLYPK